MRVQVGSPVQCTIPCPAGPPDSLGARIEQPLTGNVIVPWVPAELESAPAVDANGERFTQWGVTVTLDCPAAGDYCLVWTGDAEPEPVAVVPLNVA